MGTRADKAVNNHKSFHTCSGSVLSAEYVLEQKFGAESAKKIEEFEERFKAADKGSVMCSDLRGKVPGSCRACVTDAAKILEDMIEG